MGQTLIDIAIQHYGNQEAVPILIDDNPDLITDSVEFELTGDLSDPDSLTFRDEDDLKDKKVLKELDGKIIVS